MSLTFRKFKKKYIEKKDFGAGHISSPITSLGLGFSLVKPKSAEPIQSPHKQKYIEEVLGFRTNGGNLVHRIVRS